MYYISDGNIVAENGIQLKVGDCLKFMIGSRRFPPGTPVTIDVRFAAQEFPTMSTCVPQIMLPLDHARSKFMQRLTEAVLGANCFGFGFAAQEFPTVSTCVPQITLPLDHSRSKFMQRMTEAVLGADCFGL
jgi:hypothetical protein